MKRYTLHMKEDMERQLKTCRPSIRRSIAEKLQEILRSAQDRAPSDAVRSRGAPPQRFYVSESYRVSYEIDPRARRVMVLELRSEPA